LIYVIGDNHTSFFKFQKGFVVYHIGPATAYILSKNSSTNFNKKLYQILQNINKNKDILILVFGEIDFRIHIYYQYMKQERKKSINDLIIDTIVSYGNVLILNSGFLGA
jgi:hypothetical protein